MILKHNQTARDTVEQLGIELDEYYKESIQEVQITVENRKTISVDLQFYSEQLGWDRRRFWLTKDAWVETSPDLTHFNTEDEEES